MQERRARVNEMLMMIVGGGRSASASAPPALTDEVLVGGALAVIRARLSRPTHRPLLSLLNELMAVLAHAYLGADAAAESFKKTTVKQPAHKPETVDGSVLPVRLTHRTLAVLAAIAEEPGALNREVSDAAGIADQGQVSRLLGRLESAQLIRNDGEPEVGAERMAADNAKGNRYARRCGGISRRRRENQPWRGLPPGLGRDPRRADRAGSRPGRRGGVRGFSGTTRTAKIGK